MRSFIEAERTLVAAARSWAAADRAWVEAGAPSRGYTDRDSELLQNRANARDALLAAALAFSRGGGQ
jgi:hypothetical protein